MTGGRIGIGRVGIIESTSGWCGPTVIRYGDGTEQVAIEIALIDRRVSIFIHGENKNRAVGIEQR